MPTRRSFLLSSLIWTSGGLLLETLASPALAKKVAKTPVSKTGPSGPHTLFKEEWPPAILPAHVGIADKGYLCFTDDFGRLAIVDMARKPLPGKSPFKVLASLSGLGKVIDFAVTTYTAYCLVYRDNENQEPVVTLVSISLVPASNPTILSEFAISRMSEASSLVAAGETLCISGQGTSGENMVSIYGAPSRRGGAHEPTYIASLSVALPVRMLELSDKQLLILSSDPTGNTSQLDCVTLTNPSSPQIQSSATLKGDFRVLSKFKDTALVAGYEAGSRPGKGNCVAKTIQCGANARETSSITLDPILTVESTSAQKDRFVVVGRSAGKRSLITLVRDSGHALQREQVIDLKTSKIENGLPAQGTAAVIYREPVIYVASGWSGVQLLTRAKADGFALSSTYSIPRLAASGLAMWGSNVVLSGSELQLYSISRPDRPLLVATSEPPSAVKSLVGAGSYVLCLSKDDLTLRKMEKLPDVLATYKINANQVAFDKSQQVAYAIKSGDKSTKVTRIKVFPDALEKDTQFDVPGIFSDCQALAGQLVLTGISDLALLGKDEAGAMKVKATRKFDNLALRDCAITDDAILLTAVDKNSRGFFMVLAKNEGETRTMGSIDLPHDGVALAAQESRAVAVGRGQDGKDIATIINYSQPSAPQLTGTIPVLEGVSSVSIKDKIAVLAGRGLEIVSL